MTLRSICFFLCLPKFISFNHRALEFTTLYFGYRVLTKLYDSPKFLDGRIKHKFEAWIHENIGALFDKGICSFESFCEWMTENSHLSLFLLILNAEFEDKFKPRRKHQHNSERLDTDFLAA